MIGTVSASANRKTKILIANAGVKSSEQDSEATNESNDAENSTDNTTAPPSEKTERKHEGRIVTADINFHQKDLSSFRGAIEINLRKTKEDPIYTISEMSLRRKIDNSVRYDNIDASNFIALRDEILNTPVTDLVKMRVRFFEFACQ